MVYFTIFSLWNVFLPSPISREHHSALMMHDFSSPSLTRDDLRILLSKSIFVLPLIAYPRLSNAQKGAFELDAEYYVRNLLGNQKLDKDQVIFPSPRSVDDKISSNLVNIVKNEISTFTKISSEKLSMEVAEMLPIYLNYFRKFVPISNLSLTDQYYLDIVLYILFLIVQKEIIDPINRYKFSQSLGENSMNYIVNSGYITMKLINNDNNNNKSELALYNKSQQLAKDIKSILDFYQEYGLISSYSFDDENLLDMEYLLSSLDSVSYYYIKNLLSFIYLFQKSIFYIYDYIYILNKIFLKIGTWCQY